MWIIEGHHFVGANAAALAAVGYGGTPETLRLHPAELSPELQPDGESSYAKAERHIDTARQKGVHSYEWLHCRSDGTPLPVEVTLSAIDHGGRQLLHCVWRDLTERDRAERLLRLEHTVAACIAGADDPSAALADILRAICESENWGFGLYWRADAVAGVLRFGEYWSLPDAGLQRYAEATRSVVFAPGVGMVGQVYESGQPLWVADTAQDARVVQQILLKTGLRSLFAFPLFAAERVIGVLAFLSRELRQPDERLLASARMLGSQIGQFLQRKYAEEALRESEARWSFALEGSRDGVWDRDFRSGKVFFSKRYKEMLGYSEDEIGDGVEEWESLLHPEEKSRVLAALQAHLEYGSGTYANERRMRCKDGGWKWILSRGMVVSRDGDGRPLRMIGTHTDITETKLLTQNLQQSHDLLIRLSEQVPGMIYQYRLFPDGHVCYPFASDAIREIYELSSEEVRESALPVRARLHPLDQEAVRVSTLESARTMQPWRLEFRVILPRQGVRWRQGSAQPQKLEDGSVLWHGFMSDITERKRADQMLELEHAVSRRLTAAEDASSGMEAVIRTICEMTEWERGTFWKVDQSASVLRFGVAWNMEGAEFADYVEGSRNVTFAPGAGLIGHAWKSGEPQWFADAGNDPRMVRKMLARESSIFIFPVVSQGEILGMLSFFTRESREPDQRLLKAVRTIGEQIGQFLQRKRAEDALRESEARYRALTELSTDWYWEQDEHLRFTHRSRQNSPGGIPPDIALGKTRREVREIRWDEVELAALEAITAARLPFRDFEIGRSYLGDPKQYVQLSGEPVFDTAGRFAGYRGVGKNVTERRRSEEGLRIFRAVMNATADGIYLTDRASMRFIDVNEAACRMQGMTREEMLAIGPHQLLSIPREEMERIYDECIACAGSTQRFEKLRARRDGAQVWLEIERSAQRWGEGWVVLTLVRDISERKLAEQAREQLEGQLRESQKMEAIGTLAGGIAHDFNNILGAILGNVALARQDVGDAHPALESLGEIHNAGERGRDMVQQILAFSRRQPRKLVVLPLQPVIEEAVKLLRVTLPAGVGITTALSKTPIHLRADPTQLQQILLNLCTNAWQALDGRGGRILIELEETVLDVLAASGLAGLRPGRHAHLAVSDTGRGMDAATLARIFDPFFTTNPVGTSTGLGMSVVHGIAKAHEGAIAIDSTVGQGTTVHLYFPVSAATPDAAAPEAKSPALVRGGGQRVLYVDDDESMVFLVTRMLDRMGFATTGRVLAQDALDAVRADPDGYDLVVTDFNMPVMSGLEVAQELAALRPDLPVVITSGYITEELQRDASKIGVRHLLHKPNTVDELCSVIEGLLATPR